MDLLDLLMRVLHIFGATILVGATVFMLMAVIPAMGKMSGSELFASLRPHWAMLVGVGSGLLFVSGLYNTARFSMRYDFSETNYHALLGVKIVLALVVFFLAAVVSGRSNLAAKLQQKLSMWLAVTLALLMTTLAVAGYMKTVDHVEKKPDSAETAQAARPHPTRG